METFTIREAAQRCQISYEALRRRVDRGTVQTVRKEGIRLIPRGELERVDLWPGARSDAPEEVQRLQVELERVRGELKELRLLPRKVDEERQAREVFESKWHQERTTRQAAEARLQELELAHVEISRQLDQLSKAGFFAFARRRLLRRLRRRTITAAAESSRGRLADQRRLARGRLQLARRR